jgi:hypothetical protein
VSDFHPEEIEKLARLEHGRWSDEKHQQSWNYAPERDDERKLHPDLVEWADLPDARKEINRNFVRSWLAMLRRAGIQVIRG